MSERSALKITHTHDPDEMTMTTTWTVRVDEDRVRLRWWAIGYDIGRFLRRVRNRA